MNSSKILKLDFFSIIFENLIIINNSNLVLNVFIIFKQSLQTFSVSQWVKYELILESF